MSLYNLISEFLKLSNYKKFWKALKFEPFDIVLQNTLRKILNLQPLDHESSNILKLKRYTKKTFRKIRLASKRTLTLSPISPKPSFFIHHHNHDSKENSKGLIQLLNNQLYKHYNIVDDLTQINLLDNQYLVLLQDVEAIHPSFLTDLALFINANKPKWFYCNHISNNNSLNQIFKKHYKPKFNLDFFISINFITCPLVLSNSIDLQIFKRNNLFKIEDVIWDNYDKTPYLQNENIAEITLKNDGYNISEKSLHIRKLKIEKELDRIDIKGELIQLTNGTLRFKREIITNELVSIIIPFKNELEITESCISEILKEPKYKEFEIILISNNSDKKVVKYFQNFCKELHNVKFFEFNEDFNYSRINNWGLKKASGKYILFLNNDILPLNSEWLENMVRHVQRKDVGGVGSLLLYPDNSIQHAGVCVGSGHVAAHTFVNYPDQEYNYMLRTCCDQEYTAVTAACLMTKKEILTEIGYFDELNLPISNNDVDLCLRIKEKGYKIIFTPFSKLIHYESKSRKSDIEDTQKERYLNEVIYMQKKWKTNTFNDPFFSNELFKLINDSISNPQV